MKAISRPDSLDAFLALLDEVEDSHDPVVLSGQGHEPVVVLRLDDYQAMKGIAGLLRAPDAKRKLQDAIDRHDAKRRRLQVVSD